MTFKAITTPFCPLGNNYYRATISCEIELGNNIVDFCDLEDYFKSLNGGPYTTEELCNEVFTTLKEEYGSGKVMVKVLSDSHFPIETIKEG